MSTAEIQPTPAPQRHRGMTLRLPPITARTTTATAASLRLFGDIPQQLSASSHRGERLRYILRRLYGADYIRRGALLLGVAETALSQMMMTGLRVSRRRIHRLEGALSDRKRERRKELRALGVAIAEAFDAELEGLSSVSSEVSILLRQASVAANTHNPHSRETGRFVPRVQRKAPVMSEPLREPGGAAARKKRRRR